MHVRGAHYCAALELCSTCTCKADARCHAQVTFRRQPENPYDQNATQVLNTFEQQVGHLPRTVVLRLAPLLDSGALALEAVIPRGSKNKYKIPLKLFVYAANDQVAAVRAGVAGAGLGLTMSDPQAERFLEVRATERCARLALSCVCWRPDARLQRL